MLGKHLAEQFRDWKSMDTNTKQATDFQSLEEQGSPKEGAAGVTHRCLPCSARSGLWTLVHKLGIASSSSLPTAAFQHAVGKLFLEDLIEAACVSRKESGSEQQGS